MKYSLIGIDGNAFSIMGYVKRAMKSAYSLALWHNSKYWCEKFNSYAQDMYIKEATASDYNNLLAISQSMIETVNGFYEKVEEDD